MVTVGSLLLKVYIDVNYDLYSVYVVDGEDVVGLEVTVLG